MVFYLIFFFIFGFFPLIEAEDQDTLLTLRKALEYATNYSLSIREAFNNRESSALELIAAEQNLLPTARTTLSAGGRRQFSLSSTSFSAGVAAGADYEISSSRYLSYRAAGRKEKASGYIYEQSRKDLVAEVILQYVKTISALKLIEVEQSNVDYQHRKLEEIEALFEQGIKAKSDVLNQKTALSEASSGLLKAVHSYRKEKFLLLEQLSLDFPDRYKLDTSSVVALYLHLSVDSSYIKDTGNIIKGIDEIAAQRLRVAAAEEELKASRWNYFPAVSFSAGVSSEVIEPADMAGVSALQFGASLGIPIFDKKQRWLKVKNAEVSLQKEKLKLERLERSKTLEIEQAFLEDRLAEERIAAASVRLEAAKEALQATEERYNVGASRIIELNAAQTSYAEAHSEFIRAKFDCIISRIGFFRSTGRIGQVVDIINKLENETEH